MNRREWLSGPARRRSWRGRARRRSWPGPSLARGRILFPQMYNERVVEELRRVLGRDRFEATHNQRPMA